VRGRVLAQIVDEATGKVLNNQITPVPLRMDGRRRRVTLPLEIVSATVRRGQRLTLQIVAQSSLYDTNPEGGTVRFGRIRLTLPTIRSS
jgi:ABC-2 type transport system ATP-binding protein